MIEYLSETYGVPINAVSFDIFSLDDRQVLVRQFVREESLVKPTPTNKKRPSRTLEQFVAAAQDNGVRGLVKTLC